MEVRQDILKISRDWRVEVCSDTIVTVLPIAKSDIILFNIPFSVATKRPNLDDLQYTLFSADSVSIKHKVRGMNSNTILVRGGAFIINGEYKLSLDISFFDENLIYSKSEIENMEWVYEYMASYVSKLPEPFTALRESPTSLYNCSLALPKSFFHKIKISSGKFKYKTHLSSKFYIGTNGIVTGATSTHNFTKLSSRIYPRISVTEDFLGTLEASVKSFKGSYGYLSRKLKETIVLGDYRLVSKLPAKISCNGISEVLRIQNGMIAPIDIRGGYTLELGDVIVRESSGSYTIEQVTSIGYLKLIVDNKIICRNLTPVVGSVYKYLYHKLSTIPVMSESSEDLAELNPKPEKVVEQVKMDLAKIEAPLIEDLDKPKEDKPKKVSKPKPKTKLTEEERTLSKNLDNIVNQVF